MEGKENEKTEGDKKYRGEMLHQKWGEQRRKNAERKKSIQEKDTEKKKT